MDNIILAFSYLLPIINTLLDKEFSKENITGLLSDYEKNQVTLTIPLAMYLLLHGQKIDENKLSNYLSYYNLNWSFYFNLLQLQEPLEICADNTENIVSHIFLPLLNVNSVTYRHNLGSYPIYTIVYDNNNNVVLADLKITNTTITASFNNNFTGILSILLMYPTMQTFIINNQTSITIAHGLGRKPIAFTVYDSLGNVVICAENANNTNLTLEFNQPFTGTVILI